MAHFNLNSVANALETVEEEGLVFEDLQQAWTTGADVQDVVDALNSKSVVHYLKLDGNTLGVDAAAAIGAALKAHPEFRKALWKNMFTGRLKNEIPAALRHLSNGMIEANAHLTVLDLSDNALGPNGMQGLVNLLSSPVVYSLQELYLNNCGLGIGGGRMLSKALLECHQKSLEAGTPLSIKIFVAGRNRLENDGAKALAKTFATIKSFKHIAMPQNSIYHIGIAALADAFKQNPHLEILNLNDNTITSKGALALSNMLKYTPNIHEINLGDCLLKIDGAYHLASALEEHHEQLETLDLGYNEINTDAAVSIIAALKNKPNLKFLNLDGNCFGDKGRQRIFAEMQTTFNPDALQSLEDDNSDVDTTSGGDEYVDDNNGEEDDEVEHDNDTTEEADDYDYKGDGDVDADEEEYENDNDESAYITCALTTKMINETMLSTKTVSPTGDNKKQTTAKDFCLSQKPCTLKMFESIEDQDKLKALKDIIELFAGDNRLLLHVFTALKCAHVSRLSKDALNVAVALYKELFDYAVKTNQVHRVLNYLLIQLGLLRTEQKFKSDYDFKSCRYAVSEALKTQNIENDTIKNTLKLYLENIDG